MGKSNQLCRSCPPPSMFAPSVAPAKRRPAGPARRDRRERRGRESDQDRMRRRRRRERRGLPSEERKRKDPKRGNQPNPHSTRKWQQAAAAEAAPHYFLHRLRGYRRHGHRLLQALSPPPPVGRSDGLGTKSRKENDRPTERPSKGSFRLRLLDCRRARWRRATRSTNRRR